MKTQLTAEQSAELISKGVSADRASKWISRQVSDYRGRPLEKARLKRWKDCMPHDKSEGRLKVGLMRFEDKDMFTLSDLLSLLPKEINGYTLKIEAKTDKWEVEYSATFKYDGWEALQDADSAELIDALYELALWAADNKHLTKE